MELIIAEKPSVALSYAAALGVRQRKEGYMENDQYLISWCIGHLAGLADAGQYDERYIKWELKDLPILPETWRFVANPNKKKQFDILCSLMARKDVTHVINACDAGREGELIFRTVYELSGCKKPMKRLWLSSMEDDAIREGFQQLKDGSEYDGLYQSALCRSKADWLVGINATRFFTMLYHCKLKVGRVMSPTLAMIVQREAEIKAFVPEPFFTVELNCGGITVTGERISSKTEAKSAANACRNSTAVIKSLERKERTEKPPALYDLTSLQREANRVLGYTAQQTLDYLQSLYEKKLCTYPRTDSRYLTDDMENTVPDLVRIAVTVCGMEEPGKILSAQICDSKKVTDHHAIVPTRSAVETDMAALPAGEREILRLVALALLRAVCPPYRYEETVLTAECAGQKFTAKGRTVLDLGWKAYAKEQREASQLPDGLTEGQTLPVEDVQIKNGKTTPPPHYDEDKLLAAMETAGDKDIPEDAERRGIGTPATRAGIIEKLVADGYMVRRKNKKNVQLVPSDIGHSLITVLPEQLQSPQLTAEWEQRLKQVERGELSPESFNAEIADMVSQLIQSYEPVAEAEVLFDSHTSVGKCPRCGHPVTERAKGFFCDNKVCTFVLWKENRFFASKHKQLTGAVAEALLNDGKAQLKGCWSEKKGKTYDATVILEDDGERTGFKLVF